MKANESTGYRLLGSAIALSLLMGIILISDTAVCAAENMPTVAVQNKVWVKGEKVYLKDVAKIGGPSHMAKALGEIYLAYAPAPGREKKLHGDWVRSKIQSKPWVPANTPVRVPQFITVGRRCQRVDDERFLQLYRGHIAEQLKERNTDFQVRRFKVIGNRPFPEGELKVKLASLGAGEYMGNVNLSAVVYIDGTIERRVSLSGWVDRFEEVVCCQQSLPRHSVISEENLCLRRKNISRLSSQVIKAPQLAIGKRLKHSAKAGSVLMVNSLEDVPVVKRGDRVTIVAESEFLRVTALGIAEERGTVGDQIRVKNCMGKREVVAGIVDSSTVRIEF